MRQTQPVALFTMAQSELIKTSFDKHGYFVRDAIELAPRGIDAKRIAAFNKLRQDFEVLPLGEWGASATVTLKAPKPKGLWGMLFSKKDRPGVKTTTGFILPCITVLELVLPIGKLVLWDANIPVDDHTTITKWISMRSFFRGDWADGDARKRVLQIFEQDKPIVEAQRPELVPADAGAELSVRSDSLQIAYRRLRRKALQNGWALDRTRIQKELTRPGATVIPSPARREQAELERAWVHHEVPVQEAEKPKG